MLFIMTDLAGGGAEKALVKLLKFFDYEKYDVSLCLLHRQGIYLDEIPKEVNLIVLLEQEPTFFLRKAIKNYYRTGKIRILSWFIHHYKIKKKYDVIVSFLEGTPLFLHSFVLDLGKRNVSWVHCDLQNHSSEQRFYTPKREELMYQQMDDIIFVSDKIKNNFDNRYKTEGNKHYLYNIIDCDEIRNCEILPTDPTNIFTITSIGSLSNVKGFDRLIQAAGRLKKDGYSFRVQIIGQGAEESNLKKLVNDLDLRDEVLFLGFKQPPYPYLRGSDLFVSASRSEGLSLVICESFVLGIPVIATKTSGAMELLDNGKYGLLVDHDDYSIYEGIKSMIDNPLLRAEYEEKSRLRSEIFNTTETMQQAYRILFGD